MAGTWPVREKRLGVHEAGDGEPAFYPGGALGLKAPAAALEVADPEIELDAEPGVQGDEESLDDKTDALRTFGREARWKFFGWSRGLRMVGSPWTVIPSALKGSEAGCGSART